ncbi:restriction endonuclease subunit S [Novosphingobium sp.]|uniref:restriction endonuclease subunit S n=1 Tax=Novosphingobium sp. TaxID=1874826 RepID=UPI0038BAC27F
MTDIASLVSDNLDIWTAAIERKSSAGRGSGRKLSLYGIERLRALILDLAVHGKLVPQDPEDAPASELLPGMAAERQRRIKAGEIKNAKGPAKPNGEPFELPSGWLWLPLWQTGNIVTGNSINAALRSELEANGEGWPFVATKDVGYGFEPIDYDNGLTVRFDDQRFNIARANSVFICAEGGSAGRKMAVSDREIAFGNKLIANEPWPQIESRYILYTYLSDFFFECFSREMTGIIGGISRAKFLALPFPLPPYAEQQRIVTKVDELMTLCEALEAQSAAALDAHQKLVEALLATLVDSADANDLATNWSRLEVHFDTLFTTEVSVQSLKETVLELAVRGKIVRQNAIDEPVDTLIKQVSHHQVDRYKKREIQKPKRTTTETNPPLILPENWANVLLGDLCFVTKLAGFEYTKHIKLEEFGDVPVIRAQNVRPFFIDKKNLKYISSDVSHSLNRCALDRPALLITFIGAGIGDVCQFNEDRRWHLAPNVAKAEPFGPTSLDYLTLYMNSPTGRAELFKHMKSTAQPSLSMGTIREVWVALPPLAEQQRIVAKVGQLLALCDDLKARLATAAETRKYLADAIVERAAA